MTKHREERMRDNVNVPLSAELNAALNMAKRETRLSRAEIARRALVFYLENHYGKTVLQDGNPRERVAQS